MQDIMALCDTVAGIACVLSPDNNHRPTGGGLAFPLSFLMSGFASSAPLRG
jgi:hypothetical protein